LRYLQRSQRYCNEVEAEMTKPESIGKDPQAGVRWNRLMQKVAWLYSFMTGDLGVRKEDARYILPNACHTEMSIAGNLQGWFDFLRLRLGKHAQWEIRDLAKQIYQHLNAAAPSIFNPDMLIVQPKLNLEFPE
jgi:thymidylate synthase (FAD)